SPSCVIVHTPVPSNSPCATSLKPLGGVDSVTMKFQRSVYGRNPLVHRSITRPVPSGPGGLSSLTSRYTLGHHFLSAGPSARMSNTSRGVAWKRHRLWKTYSGAPATPALVLQVGRVEQLFLRALDPLPRPHDLDQLLTALGRPDHDRADQPVVLEEQLAIELLLEAVGAHRFEVGLDVRRHAGHRERRAEHRRRVRRH